MKTINGIPRWNRVDLYTEAEESIGQAIDEVEVTGCHPLLTEAVVLLTQAKGKVADFVELGELWQCPTCGHVMTEDKSKSYKQCPQGFHPIQHVKLIPDSDSPKSNECDKLREVVKWIASQQNLFFAECSQAEEIVKRCREALQAP